MWLSFNSLYLIIMIILVLMFVFFGFIMVAVVLGLEEAMLMISMCLVSFSLVTLWLLGLSGSLGESSLSVCKGLLVVMELFSLIFFFLGLGLGNVYLMMVFVFFKFNVFPLVTYLFVLEFSDLSSFWNSFVMLSYISLNKVWGVVVFLAFPVEYYFLISFSMLFLILLLISMGSELKDLFVSFIFLDGLMALTMLMGGLGLKVVFVYMVISYIIQVKASGFIYGGESVSFVNFYCMFVMAGGPLHPMVFFKYMGIACVSNLYVSYSVTLMFVYVVYFSLFLFTVSNSVVFKSFSVSIYVGISLVLSIMVLVLLFNSISSMLLEDEVLVSLEDEEFQFGVHNSFAIISYEKILKEIILSVPEESVPGGSVYVNFPLFPWVSAKMKMIFMTLSLPEGESGVSSGSVLDSYFSGPKISMWDIEHSVGEVFNKVWMEGSDFMISSEAPETYNGSSDWFWMDGESDSQGSSKS